MPNLVVGPYVDRESLTVIARAPGGNPGRDTISKTTVMSRSVLPQCRAMDSDHGPATRETLSCLFS